MKILEELKKHWVTLVFFVGILWSIFCFYQGFLDNMENLDYTTKTTQQMALKSVIWNEAIPIAERASACDVYLSSGFNSLTKKECEIIIQQGEEQGIFRLNGNK